MATKEPAKTGLLAKVVRFVANPTTNWEALDAQSTMSQSQDPRQADRDAMKALIEIKRRNDFVRQREFNMLRKIRQKESGQKASAQAEAKPSFFHSSLPSKNDAKSNTLKKINEIEAQMSMQWWTTKHANSSILSSSTFGASLPQTMAPEFAKPNKAKPAPPPVENENLLELSLENIAKKPDPAVAPLAPATTATYSAMAATTPPTIPATVPVPMPGPVADSGAHMFAVEVGEIMHNPNLEEAAIRFANGDDEGAEQALKDALVADQSGHHNEDAWLALFDLYRATSKHEKFEAAALDYATYFQRSAPQWISFPDLLDSQRKPTGDSEPPQTHSHWKCPPTLGVQSVAALKVVLEKIQPPWCLDWSRLTRIDEAAVDSFYQLITHWCNSASVQLIFEGTSILEQVLAGMTPTSNNEVDHRCWHLRMEALRLLHRPDEFEMVALDYCVTYEVSPPSWQTARCKCRSTAQAENSRQASYSVMSSMISLPPVSDFHSTNHPSDSGTPDAATSTDKLISIEISGHIQGDPQQVIDRLNKSAEGADLMVISCEKLVRIDFSAAGTLLNWVIAQQQQGRRVQFVQIHRLILAFFYVIGITDHALTSVRMH
jgi:anti-anti-sigma regulatory factor